MIMQDFDAIYSTVMGRQGEGFQVSWVDSGFAEDSGIRQAYEELWAARDNLCRRFGLDWEDDDLERIMDAVLTLESDLARRIFACGVEYTKRGFRL